MEGDWSTWKEALSEHYKECIDIYLQYYKKGDLKKIMLKINEDMYNVVILLDIDDKIYEVDVEDYGIGRWDRERLRECYFADELWVDYMEYCNNKNIKENLDELCESLKKIYGNIIVEWRETE